MNDPSARYVEIKKGDHLCEAQHFGPVGLPVECGNAPVWELGHGNGWKLYLCEYHIECFWGMWLTFREAVRDVWPVRRNK